MGAQKTMICPTLVAIFRKRAPALLLLLLPSPPFFFRRDLRGFFRCRWPEARILRGFVALAGCFPDFYDSFCSPIFKMHEFFHIFCCSANGAWLDWGWGLPENVVRCAFFVALHVGFHGKCSFCLSFWQLLCVFVDRRGGFHA